jgi:phosphohistidine phosphatase
VELYLLRHADAGDPTAWTGPDAARPLSGKGRRQASRLGSFLRDRRFDPGLVISSPKIRAAETAQIVAEATGTEMRVDDRLAEGFTLADLQEILHRHGSPQRVVLVGHDPDFSELAEELVGATIPVRKGAFLRIDVPAEPQAGSGVLRWLIPPDALSR